MSTKRQHNTDNQEFTNNGDLGDLNTDENMAGTFHLNEDIEDESAVEKLKAELEEQKDKYLRLYAEFDNFKRRSAKERVEYTQMAGKDVIASLLQVLDDTDRAEKQIKNTDDVKSIREGVQLVFSKLRSSLQSRGLRPMESIGQPFNPDLHEAITEIPAPTPELRGKVLDEIEKGYYLNDKIIRFAKVVVGK